MNRCVRLLVVGIVIMMPAILFGGVYSSGIHFTNPDSSAFDGSVTDGTGLRINYVLSDTASTVEIRIQNSVTNAVINTINLTNRQPGWNTTLWNGAGAPASAASYYVTIIATRTPRSTTSYRLGRFIFTGPTGTGFNIFSRGVDCVRDQTNPNFGYFYTSNAGLPIGRGFARYTGAGDARGTAHPNPYLAQSGQNTSGIGWSEDVSAPVHATIDDLGRVYASDFPRGQVWRMDNNTAVPKRIISNIPEPKGLAVVGTGANRKIFVCAAGMVLRANIGNADTLSGRLDTIALLGTNIRDVIFDDEGFMYVNIRSGTGFDGTLPGFTERFNITGTLPVTEFDALFTVNWTGLPMGLGHWRGANTTSAADDIIYVSHRSATTADPPGVYRLTQLTTMSPVREHLFRPSDVPGGGGGDINTRADLTVDPSGNIVFFENGNEEIIYLEPPGSAAVSYTTKSAVTFTLGTSSVEQIDGIPSEFVLKQNYPNPFNPTTNIEFSLAKSGFVSLKVYDVLGKEVAALVNDGMQAGNYRVTFDARNIPRQNGGGGLASATYFYTLRSGSFTQTKKLIVVK